MSFTQKARRSLSSFAVEMKALKSFLSLQKTQCWSTEKLQKLQERRLRLILEHAYYNVPYYRRIFRDRGLKLQDFKSIEDLVKLPIVTKDDIRQQSSDFIPRNFQKYWSIATATGGSTGEPLRFFIDLRSASAGEAALWRGWGYAGYMLGDKMAVLAGLSLVSGKENVLMSAVRRITKKTVGFPAISLRKEILDVYAKRMIEFEPKFIRGYPSSLYLFASFLEGREVDLIRPRAVFTTAEMLLPYQRKLIEEIFRCDVFDGYGAFDGGTAAFECQEHCGYHMAVEKAVMEFADEDGNLVAEGEDGRIIATDLFNYAMPFIRYDTGDMGVYSNESCSCGRKLPLMKRILGRTTDILHFKTGVSLSGPSLTLIFKDFDIKQYQVVQTSDDCMIAKVIKGKTYSEKDTEKIHRVLKNTIGDGVEVKFEFVDHIKPTKSGKWKIVTREVK
jgi:phenylacetate-CoA ligase